MTLKINKWDKYWKLTIIKEINKHIQLSWKKIRRFKCKCNCWNIKNINLKNLRTTKSCWCIKIDLLKDNKNRNYHKTHWMTNTKIYKQWNNIYRRCNDINNISYKDYGWRWIECEWNSFEEFYKDMWESNWLTIERNDVNWNYCKNNCNWIINKAYSQNKTNTIRYKWQCLKEYCIDNWLKYKTVFARYRYYWKTLEESLY